jgi:signal peptidase I
LTHYLHVCMHVLHWITPLQREDILGRARGTLRYVGMVTIILNDYPIVKYVLVGIMGLFVLTNREA